MYEDISKKIGIYIKGENVHNIKLLINYLKKSGYYFFFRLDDLIEYDSNKVNYETKHPYVIVEIDYKLARICMHDDFLLYSIYFFSENSHLILGDLMQIDEFLEMSFKGKILSKRKNRIYDIHHID